MSWIRPTLETIIDRAKSDIKSAVSVTSILRRSFLEALAKVIGGVAHLLHGHLYWMSRQIFPDQADQEYLERWASIYGFERKAATYGKYQVDITGTNGSVLPADTIYQRSDGLQYTVDSDVTIAAGIGTADITASGAGADYNLATGDEIELVSPVSGIDSTATYNSTTTEAEDEETDEQLRARLVERIQEPPSGGRPTDYILWAKEVAGVTRAWVLPGHLGEGTVGVSFVEDDETNIIPGAAKVDEVQDYIDEEKPVTADVTVFAPIAHTVDMTIAISPNTVAVQEAIQGELEDLFFREAQVAGSYETVSSTYSGEIPLSKINEAISIADGEEDHNLITPTSDVSPVTGGIAILGTITWQTLT